MVINVLTVGGRRLPGVAARQHAVGAQRPGGRRTSRWGRAGAAAALRATEVDDAAKPELLRRYLDRWYWEVKGHIAGLTPDSSDEQIRAAAPSIPVFALATADA